MLESLSGDVSSMEHTHAQSVDAMADAKPSNTVEHPTTFTTVSRPPPATSSTESASASSPPPAGPSGAPPPARVPAHPGPITIMPIVPDMSASPQLVGSDSPGGAVMYSTASPVGGHAAVGRRRSSGNNARRAPVNKRVFVGNLPKTCTVEELTTCIAEHVAMPSEVRIIKDRETNVSKGYGFLTFNTTADAERCLVAQTVTCQKRLLNFGPAKHRRRSDDFSPLPNYGVTYSPTLNEQGAPSYYDAYAAYNHGYAMAPGPEYPVGQQYETYPQSPHMYWSPAYGGHDPQAMHYGYTNVQQVMPYAPAMVSQVSRDAFGLQQDALAGSPVPIRRGMMPAPARVAVAHYPTTIDMGLGTVAPPSTMAVGQSTLASQQQQHQHQQHGVSASAAHTAAARWGPPETSVSYMMATAPSSAPTSGQDDSAGASGDLGMSRLQISDDQSEGDNRKS
eukprot:m.92233 g.92233  ORF g.92233 m.92233 type:complete len:450 (-) comp9948_c0_seq1:178-1527(-)